VARRLAPTAAVLSSALLLLFGACETGFRQYPPQDDDSSWPDDDDSGGDDDSSPPGDDDTAPPGDDDTAPPGDDDSSPSGNFEGDQPGECSDGADNDQDGFFDCDDPDCFGAPDCGGDDDASPGDDDDATPGTGAPEIVQVTYQWIPVDTTFEFAISIVDLDCDLTPVILYWSLNGAVPTAQSAIGDPSPPSPPVCATTYTFDLQIVNAGPGLSYAVVFSVEDSSGNRSADYTLQAQVPN